MTKEHYSKILAWRRYDPVAREKWLRIREKVHDRAGGKCEMCRRDCPWEQGNVHHTPEGYRWVMEEEKHLETLQWVHNSCHKLHHRREKRRRKMRKVVRWFFSW